MKPLILLLIVFGVAAIFCAFSVAGNIAMCAMLCFTALGHFKFHRGMEKMLPARVPLKNLVVYASGVAEILLGVGLLFPAIRHVAAIVLIVFLVLVLPANINAARQHINYETGESDGKGLEYLWFRVPLQAFFIGWIVYFSILS
jgi:uncharacterized membrane protein